MSKGTTNIFFGFWELSHVRSCWCGYHRAFSGSCFIVISGRKIFRWCAPLSPLSAKLPHPLESCLFCISRFAFSLVFLYPDVLLKGTSPKSLKTQGIPEKEHTCLLISSCRGTWGSAARGASALALLLLLHWVEGAPREWVSAFLTCCLGSSPNNEGAGGWREEMNATTESLQGFSDLARLIPNPHMPSLCTRPWCKGFTRVTSLGFNTVLGAGTISLLFLPVRKLRQRMAM